jgi:hypothetical protein
MSTWGDGVARSWTAIYTRGLPAELAERRREEIGSDLFEHASFAGVTPAQQVHVLGRVLWGIPADLSWRRAARASRERRLATGGTMTLQKSMSISATAVTAIYLWFALGFAFGGYWGSLLTLAGAILIGVGLRVRDEHPRPSTVLFIVGSLLGVASAFWMAVLLVPLWLGFSALAIASEPGRRTPAPAAT